MKKLFTIYLEGFRRTLRYFVFLLLLQIAGLPAILVCFLLFKAFGYNTASTVSFDENPLLCSLLIVLTVLYLPFAFYFVSEICKMFRTPVVAHGNANE